MVESVFLSGFDIPNAKCVARHVGMGGIVSLAPTSDAVRGQIGCTIAKEGELKLKQNKREKKKHHGGKFYKRNASQTICETRDSISSRTQSATCGLPVHLAPNRRSWSEVYLLCQLTPRPNKMETLCCKHTTHK